MFFFEGWRGENGETWGFRWTNWYPIGIPLVSHCHVSFFPWNFYFLMVRFPSEISSSNEDPVCPSRFVGLSGEWVPLAVRYTVDGPAFSTAPVENGGKHPTNHRISTIGGAGFRWPIHSMGLKRGLLILIDPYGTKYLLRKCLGYDSGVSRTFSVAMDP